jgi:hypothetical protein
MPIHAPDSSDRMRRHSLPSAIEIKLLRGRSSRNPGRHHLGTHHGPLHRSRPAAFLACAVFVPRTQKPPRLPSTALTVALGLQEVCARRAVKPALPWLSAVKALPMCRYNDPRYRECVSGAGLIKPTLLSLVRESGGSRIGSRMPMP